MTRAALAIAAHEWRVLWREGLVVSLGLVLTLATTGAGLAGMLRVAEARADHEETTRRVTQSRNEIVAAAEVNQEQADDRASWGGRHPDCAAKDRGTWAPLGPAPLLALAVGQTDTYPPAYKVTAARRDGALTGAALANPLSLAVGAFDMVFVLVFLLPAVLAAATFDLVTAERERGTLALLLAQGVPPTAVLLGKLVPRAALVVAPAIGVPILIHLIADGEPHLARLALWVAVTVAYATFWLGCAAVVGVRARSSVRAALTLGGLWVALAIVVPAALNLLVTSVALTPSGVRLADATRAATRDALSDGSRVLGHFLEDHPTASAVGRDGLRQYALLQAARDQEVERRLRPLLDEWAAALERQRVVTWWLQLVAPPVSASSAFWDAAGTAGGRHRHARAQVERFRDEWQRHFASLVIAAGPLDAAAARAMPRFHHDEEPARAAAGRVAVPVLSMLVAGIGLLWTAARVMTRAPVIEERTPP